MGKLKFLTLSLSVLFQAVQDTVNNQADASRKAVDSEERGEKVP
jgi:hypothetical protein